MATPREGPVYEFGPFRYDAGQRLLFRGAEIVPLMPKAADTLQALLEDRGRVVGKAELLKRVWPDTHVDEIGLARNISLLRKTLGGEDESGGFIETIPKRGYRFVAEVREAGTAKPAAQAQSRRRIWLLAGGLLLAGALVYWQFYAPSRYLPTGSGRAALAVAPFAVLPANVSGKAFEQGFTEVLAAELAKSPAIEVTSPSTVRRYQRFGLPMSLMARLLGLPVIVEGTIQEMGEQIRITARLGDVHSGKLIWAETYDRPKTDLATVEREVAAAIAAEVSSKLRK